MCFFQFYYWKRESVLIWITLEGVCPIIYNINRLLGWVDHFSWLICYPCSYYIFFLQQISLKKFATKHDFCLHISQIFLLNNYLNKTYYTFAQYKIYETNFQDEVYQIYVFATWISKANRQIGKYLQHLALKLPYLNKLLSSHRLFLLDDVKFLLHILERF